MSELRGHDSWKARESQPDATGDSRPDNWGICSFCGRDCEEQDFDAITGLSLCGRCWTAGKVSRQEVA